MDQSMHNNTITRRELLRATGAAAAGAGLTPLLTACGAGSGSAADGTWRNWSGSVQATPERFLFPDSENALQRTLRETAGELRAVGAGHSFSPVAASDQTMISLDHLSGLIDIERDGERPIARLRAGTTIHDAARMLHDSGYGFINQGDIDRQAVAGAVSTATHGTGVALQSFSGAFASGRLVTPGGEIVEIGDDDPELLTAAQTAVGTLGVFSEVDLYVTRRYRLHEREYTMPLRDVLAQSEGLRTESRHFEFWGFFDAETAIVKTLHPTENAPTPPAMLQLPVNTALRLASEWVLRFPGSAESVQRLLTTLSGSSERVDWAHHIFPSPRDVPFNEMEYAIPVERGLDCIDAVLQAVRASDQPVLFPFEFRYVAADEAWLSPFFEQPSVAISIHRYHKADPQPLFDVVEPVLREFGGRPHWGKMHRLEGAALAALYPRWQDFQQIRQRMDPDGRMLSPYLRRLFAA